MMETKIGKIERELSKIDKTLSQLKKLGADDSEIKLNLQICKLSLLEKKFYLLFELGDLLKNGTD